MTTQKTQVQSGWNSDIMEEMESASGEQQRSPAITSDKVDIVQKKTEFTQQSESAIGNSEEIKAIENDPTLFPNSSRIYVEGEIHKE